MTVRGEREYTAAPFDGKRAVSRGLKSGVVAKLVIALACHAGDRGFKSRPPRLIDTMNAPANQRGSRGVCHFRGRARHRGCAGPDAPPVHRCPLREEQIRSEEGCGVSSSVNEVFEGIAFVLRRHGDLFNLARHGFALLGVWMPRRVADVLFEEAGAGGEAHQR